MVRRAVSGVAAARAALGIPTGPFQSFLPENTPVLTGCCHHAVTEAILPMESQSRGTLNKTY